MGQNKLIVSVISIFLTVFASATAVAADCDACNACNRQNDQREAAAKRCREQCRQDADRREQACVERARSVHSSCRDDCEQRERECSDRDEDDDILHVECDIAPCYEACSNELSRAVERCRGDKTDCEAVCPYKPEHCPCNGCAGSIR